MTTRRLHATPPPFVDESVFSWFQRICTRHGCSMTWLREYLGIPARCDLDLDLGESQWEQVFAATGYREQWDFMLTLSLISNDVEVRRRRRAGLQRPTYRWCPACFHSDHEPYFRRSWRFGRTQCHVHLGSLLQECPQCGKAINLNLTQHLRALNLGHCLQCHAWLGSPPDIGKKQMRKRAQWPVGGRVVTDEFRSEFRRRVQDVLGANSNPELTQFDWYAGGPARASVLLIDARQFVKPDGLAERYVKWSERIPRGTPGRTILAAALSLLRAERRATVAKQHGSRPENTKSPVEGGEP